MGAPIELFPFSVVQAISHVCVALFWFCTSARLPRPRPLLALLAPLGVCLSEGWVAVCGMVLEPAVILLPASVAPLRRWELVSHSLSSFSDVPTGLIYYTSRLFFCCCELVCSRPPTLRGCPSGCRGPLNTSTAVHAIFMRKISSFFEDPRLLPHCLYCYVMPLPVAILHASGTWLPPVPVLRRRAFSAGLGLPLASSFSCVRRFLLRIIKGLAHAQVRDSWLVHLFISCKYGLKGPDPS